MFDDIIRGLQNLPEQQLISVDVVLDDDGYYDRLCPAEECGNAFKVLFEDWRDQVPEEEAFCVICGEVAEPSDFNSEGQTRYFTEQAMGHVTSQLDSIFRAATPRRVDAGMISMSLTYQPGARPIVIPSAAEPVLLQRSACENCGCHYASLGASFFCPACGHNSARTTFGGALATVRASMDLAERLSTMMDDPDAAADVARHLAEDGLVRVWSSFQRFAEATYATHPASAASPARRNAFQNLEASDALWLGATGKGYSDMLTADEHHDLARLVQARHVLAHRDGLVDADFVARSGDHRYAVGQRLVVVPADARRLVEVCEMLAAALTSSVGRQAPA